MLSFRNISLRRKQTLIIMLTSSVALLLACASFVANDLAGFRREMVASTSSLAELVGNYTTAAIDFNDPAAAEQTLAALRGEPSIVLAHIHTRDGQVFATYVREGAKPPPEIPHSLAAQHEFTATHLHLFRPITQRGEQVGTIELVATLDEQQHRLWGYVGIAGLVLAASLLAAFGLSNQLQKLISDPILQLAQMARSVALDKNYSMRAAKQGNDELGQLVDGFNEMLTQIQARDTALQTARDHLEKRVAERTQELANSLSLLNATIDSTADGILAVQFSGHVICHNHQFAAMWKIPADALTQWTATERDAFLAGQVNHPELFRQLIKDEEASPETETFNVIKLKDGRIFERFVKPQRIEGRCVGRVINCRDITQRKRAEEALLESQALYDSLEEHLPAGIFRKDKEGRYVFVNPWFCRLKNAKAGEMLGRTPPESFEQRVAANRILPANAVNEANIEAQGAGHHELIMQTGKHIEVDEEYPGPDGQRHYLHVVKSPVFGPEGKILGSQGMLFDVTAAKQVEAELAYQRDLLDTLMNYSPDSIFFKDPQSRFVKVSQSEINNLWHIALSRHRATPAASQHPLPPHLADVTAFEKYVIGKTDADLYDPGQAGAFARDEEEIIRTGKPLVGQGEKTVCSDGRVIWRLTNKVPWRDKHGNIIGTFGTSRDISELKEAETKIGEVHKQLLETSRRAGMAEVATSVLHNVGNVLNSVNVASTLVADSLRQSQAGNLAKAVALLREHEADLGTYLSLDPKGRLLPAYLAQLAEHLVDEQAAALQELIGLQKNIEHINDIVAMQQSYAKVTGVTETLQPTELVEDALRMNASALERHEIETVRDFSEVSPITVEKHKVLQILVNLIRNAKRACDDSGRIDKQMTLRVTGDTACIRISVGDNGVGIPRENLTRIFNHGFTTRKDGHGFGLHSGALAARELGGVLVVHSDGPGKGAVFTLELPARKNHANLTMNTISSPAISTIPTGDTPCNP